MDLSCIAKCSDALKFYADFLHDWSLVTTGLRFKCASMLGHGRSAVGTDTLQMQYRYAGKSYYVNIELWRLSTSLLKQFKKFKLRYPEQILKLFYRFKNVFSYLVQLAFLNFFVQVQEAKEEGIRSNQRIFLVTGIPAESFTAKT